MALPRGFGLSILLNSLLCGLAAGALDQITLNEICKGHSLEVIAHPEGTDKYIFCKDNVNATQHSCRVGYCFSTNESKCVPTNGLCETFALNFETSKEDCRTEDFWMKTIRSKNCEKYYLCVEYNVTPIPIKCKPNHHFSRFENKCVPMADAYCMPPELWCNNQPNGKRFPANECYQYYECSNQKRLLKECSPQQYYDATSENCVQGQCKNKDGSLSIRKPDCTGVEGAYKAHTKCNMYYVCIKNVAWEIQCPNGYYYEELAEKCVKDVENKCIY